MGPCYGKLPQQSVSVLKKLAHNPSSLVLETSCEICLEIILLNLTNTPSDSLPNLARASVPVTRTSPKVVLNAAPIFSSWLSKL